MRHQQVVLTAEVELMCQRRHRRARDVGDLSVENPRSAKTSMAARESGVSLGGRLGFDRRRVAVSGRHGS